MNTTNQQKQRRRIRTRSNVQGTKERPRLSIFKSNSHIYVQIIDDTIGETLVGISDKSLSKQFSSKLEIAKALGVTIAKKAIDKKIKSVALDKGEYKYHGHIKALAEGAREGGLDF